MKTYQTNIVGSSGIYTTLDGLKVAYLSGTFDSETFYSESSAQQQQQSDSNPSAPLIGRNTLHYSFRNIDQLSKVSESRHFEGVDLLITGEWPLNLEQASDLAQQKPGLLESLDSGHGLSQPVADLTMVLKPRYHFASGQPVFFEREPFLTPRSIYPTRFLGLSDFGNSTKERWFYAMNMEPLSSIQDKSSLSVHPPNVTPCPLSFSKHKKRHQQDPPGGNAFFFDPSQGGENKKQRKGPPQGYCCKICNEPGHWIQDCPKRKDKSSAVPEGYVCRICSEPGHFVRDCPKGGNKLRQGILKRSSEF